MHFVDFFWPDKAGPQGGWPAMVSFHGSNGDKSELHGFCKKNIEQSEYTRACVPANFREKGVEHKQKQEDASKAVWWLVNNAASYKIHRESILLYGYSLGGFLANHIVWNEREFSSKYVAAAVFSAGVGKNIVNSAVTKFSLYEPGKVPPLLAISSRDDNVVKYEYSEDYYEKLKALGVTVHFLKYYTSGHFPGKEPSFYEQIDAFLDSPTTYVAPDTINMTTTPAPGACKNFCFKHSKEWSAKCLWPDCNTCDECDDITTTTTTPPPKCAGWCGKKQKVGQSSVPGTTVVFAHSAKPSM
jgi:predicted esterase